MAILRSLRLSSYRRVWSDARRKRLTLESFASTEEDGGRDLLGAARRIGDPELRAHVERHARDELRHAALLRDRARASSGAELGDALPEKPYDLSRGRRKGELDAHGFFNAGLYDELGEVEYVAMLHVAERRAAELFELHARLCTADPDTAEVFREILRDEKYHVAYTGRLLEQWRASGRSAEVRRALRNARTSRWFGAWKRLGGRSGAAFGHALLLVLYWTLLLPFGLVSRAKDDATGWRAPRRGADSDGAY